MIAERLRIAGDLIKKRWLEGRIAAGHGQVGEALQGLEEVRQWLA